MEDKIQKFVEKLCNGLSQDVSYKFGDMVIGYPDFLRPLVLATVQACIRSSASSLSAPPEDKKLFDNALQHMTVISIPKEMDPRKKE